MNPGDFVVKWYALVVDGVCVDSTGTLFGSVPPRVADMFFEMRLREDLEDVLLGEHDCEFWAVAWKPEDQPDHPDWIVFRMRAEWVKAWPLLVGRARKVNEFRYPIEVVLSADAPPWADA